MGRRLVLKVGVILLCQAWCVGDYVSFEGPEKNLIRSDDGRYYAIVNRLSEPASDGQLAATNSVPRKERVIVSFVKAKAVLSSGAAWDFMSQYMPIGANPPARPKRDAETPTFQLRADDSLLGAATLDYMPCKVCVSSTGLGVALLDMNDCWGGNAALEAGAPNAVVIIGPNGKVVYRKTLHDLFAGAEAHFPRSKHPRSRKKLFWLEFAYITTSGELWIVPRYRDSTRPLPFFALVMQLRDGSIRKAAFSEFDGVVNYLLSCGSSQLESALSFACARSDVILQNGNLRPKTLEMIFGDERNAVLERALAGLLLLRSGDPRSTAYLEECLLADGTDANDGKRGFREHARSIMMEYFEEICGERWPGMLKRVISSTKSRNDQNVQALIMRMGEKVVPVLCEVLQDESKPLRQADAIRYLDRLGVRAKNAVPLLIAALDDRKALPGDGDGDSLCVEAALALGSVGQRSTEVVAALRRVVGTGSSREREIAEEALRRLSRSSRGHSMIYL